MESCRFEQSCDWTSVMGSGDVRPQVPKETHNSVRPLPLPLPDAKEEWGFPLQGMLMSENSEPSDAGNQTMLFTVDGSNP